MISTVLIVLWYLVISIGLGIGIQHRNSVPLPIGAAAAPVDEGIWYENDMTVDGNGNVEKWVDENTLSDAVQNTVSERPEQFTESGQNAIEPDISNDFLDTQLGKGSKLETILQGSHIEIFTVRTPPDAGNGTWDFDSSNNNYVAGWRNSSRDDTYRTTLDDNSTDAGVRFFRHADGNNNATVVKQMKEFNTDLIIYWAIEVHSGSTNVDIKTECIRKDGTKVFSFTDTPGITSSTWKKLDFEDAGLTHFLGDYNAQGSPRDRQYEYPIWQYSIDSISGLNDSKIDDMISYIRNNLMP